MFFILTIFLGWILLNFLISSVELIFSLPNGFLKDPFWWYILIGYVVMILYGVKSPFVTTDTESPFSSIKKIEMQLFFKDIYYAVWWPYYVLRGLKKK